MIPLPEKVLVTSAWPYINVTPHLGNLVGSVLSADVTSRYYRLKGSDVLMVSGSDTHGTPIEVEAIRQGIKPKELTDRNTPKSQSSSGDGMLPLTITPAPKVPSTKNSSRKLSWKSRKRVHI